MKKIVVTGASGQIAYSLLFRLGAGGLFGSDEKIILHLLDIPEMEKAVEGVAMELEDSAFPLVDEIAIFSDPLKAFDGIDVAFLVGAKARSAGMERADLLHENAKIFVSQGQALDESASKDAKVLVVGNPCNTNCLIALHQSKRLLKKNFHAMMRLDQNRAKALLAKKANVSIREVSRVCIWGNHSATQVPDFTQVMIGKKKAVEVIQDQKWLQEEFISLVQQRGAAIISARGKSSAASAASAAIDAMRALFVPTSSHDFFTSAIFVEDNPYGIERGLVFGMPCRSKGDGNYDIVTDLNLDFYMKEKIALTQKELIEERKCIEHLIKR